ncbi:MAG: FAD:protein FMN transferase, partial [Eubacteriales bacterium]|nr:FAD:protein FMN transferase [Eubacteriales bacterium]
GIAKGYTADCLIGIFRGYGCVSACTNLGGDVAVLGRRPDGGPWRVGIRHPRREGCLLGAVMAEDCAVVTSGDYARFFVDAGGRRCHHLIDPRTGYPADSGLVSVTVAAPGAVAADALSTALFVAGLEEGKELIKEFVGTDAVFMDINGAVFLTDGMVGRFMPENGITANELA